MNLHSKQLAPLRQGACFLICSLRCRRDWPSLFLVPLLHLVIILHHPTKHHTKEIIVDWQLVGCKVKVFRGSPSKNTSLHTQTYIHMLPFPHRLQLSWNQKMNNEMCKKLWFYQVSLYIPNHQFPDIHLWWNPSKFKNYVMPGEVKNISKYKFLFTKGNDVWS